MAVSPALTAGETAALAGCSTVLRYLSPVPDVDIATARLNQVTFTYPIVQLTVDTTSADWLTIKEGDTVYIGTAAGLSDIGIYRARLVPNSTTLYIGEVGSQDPGLIPVGIRTASFADNQFVTVKRRFDIWSVLPLINAATGAIYEDRDRTVGVNNSTPAPLVNVTANGRRNHLATLIADGATFAFSATATPTSWTTSSGETFTYAWTTPASGWSGISGSTSATLTATVSPGNYVLYLTVTGSLSGATQRVVIVHIHDASTNPPLKISEMPRSDTRDRTGRRMSFDLYDNRLASVVDGAMVIYFEMTTWANRWTNSTATLTEDLDTSETGVDVSDGTQFTTGNVILIDAEQMYVSGVAANTLTVTRGYNGTTAATHSSGAIIYEYAPATDVPTATRQFVGWATRHDKSTGEGLRQASLELVSPSFLLSLLNSTSQIITATTTPTTWQQVKPALSSATFLAWYMLRWRCANVLRLFNFTPFSVDPAGQRLPEWVVDKGTVLQQIQSLATERGNFGCDSEGEFYFLRHPNLITYPRSGVVVRDSVNAALYVSASNPREKTHRVQQVRGEAFHWDGSATLPTPGYADAPKTPGQGTSQIKLPSQVVTNQNELQQLTGDRYAQANNPYPVVTVKIQRNRDVYEPAHMAFVTISIPANLSVTGTAWTANIIPSTVNKTHNPDGTSDIDLSGEGETHNLTADFVPVPVGNDSLFSVPFAPLSIDELPLPSLGDFASIVVPTAVPAPGAGTVEPTVSPGKGAIAVSADGTKIIRTYDVTVEPPVWSVVTPSEFFTAFKQVVHDKSTNFSRGAYALGNDGTNSKITYTADVYATTPTWTNGGTLPGIYTSLESAGKSSLAGGVVAYSPATGTTAVDTYNFVSSDGGWHAGIRDSNFSATYIPGTGFRRIASDDSPNTDIEFEIWHAMDTGSVITAVAIDYILSSAGSTTNNIGFTDAAEGAAGTSITTGTASAGTQTFSASGLSYTLVNGGVYIQFNIFAVAASDSVIVTGGRVTYTVAASGSASVASSTDYGASWSIKTVGTTPGSQGAFALSRYGTVSLAAVDTKLRIATTFNGSFADEPDGDTAGTYPIAARIPWYKIGSSGKTNNSATPDYYMASAAAISTESLWKIVSGVKTAITPSVTGTKALPVSAFSIGTYSSKRICFVGSVSGTRYIFKSTTAGASWTNQQITNAVSVRAQRFSPTGLIWLLAAGVSGVYYSSNGGTSWSARTCADGALFAEIFG